MTLRAVAVALMLALSLGATAPPPTLPTFNRAAWQSDYKRLKIALAQHYANLDWQVERRGLNLASADRFITAMLERAENDTAATLAMVKLIEAFRDPHLELSAGPAPDGANLVPVAGDVGGPAVLPQSCEESGYISASSTTRLPYAAAPAWREVSRAPFQAGLIGTIGIIRIPEFAEDRYLDACQAVNKPGLAGRALQLATRAELNRQLISLVAKLKARGMTRLAIDVSRNGGGSEWSGEAAALFARGRLTRTAPRLVGPNCDRSAMWSGSKPGCVAYRDLPSAETVGGKRPPAWSGPLAILADRRTASAAEEFITWLHDNGKAALAGERTSGAGCGFIDGGNSFQFTAAPMHLMIPNCSRFTRDGTNEIEGQRPDVPIDWQAIKPSDVPARLNALFPRAGR